MERERAAAAGIGRRHLVAVGGEHPRGRAVDLAEDDRLNAAREQPDAGEALAGGRGLGRRRHVLAPAGRQVLERPERAGRRECREPEGEPEPAWMGNDAEDEPAKQPLAGRALDLLLDLLARELDQPVVLHAGRAGRKAGHAAEAAVEVLGDRRVQLDRPLERPLHQPDAAARRVHLLVPELPGGARRQAEAAVHAVVDQARVHQQRMPSGSKEARTRWASGDHGRGAASATYA